MPDAHANFAYSTVATAPSPASSGTSLVVASGHGALFPAVPFNAVVWPTGAQPLSSNAEIVRVTAISTDTLTITRTQESTAARTVVVGDQISAAITKKTLTDIEVPSVITVTPSADQNDYEPTGWADATLVRFNHSAAIVVSGFKEATDGEWKWLVNVTTELPIVICDETVTSSTAANRVKLSPLVRGHLFVKPSGGALAMVYDGTTDRWRLVAIYDPTENWVWRSLRAIAASNNISAHGHTSATEATPTVASPTGSGSSYLGGLVRNTNATATSAAASAGVRSTSALGCRGGAAGRGGLWVTTHFGGSANPADAGASFIGLRVNSAATGDIDPSSLSSFFGVGTDAGQGTFRRMRNDASGGAAVTDLGANFPWNTTACYEMHIFCTPAGSGMTGIIWRTDDLSIPPLVWYETTDLPPASDQLFWHLHVGNRAAAALYSIDWMETMTRTPN